MFLSENDFISEYTVTEENRKMIATIGSSVKDDVCYEYILDDLLGSGGSEMYLKLKRKR